MPIVILNNRDHNHLRIRPPASFEFLSDVHMLPLVFQECGHAGNDYPVVFTKKQGTDELQLVAIFGIEPGKNLFVNDGLWQGLYMPAIIQNMPFKLVNDSQDPGRLVLGLDTDNELVSETEGNALFNETGGETEFLQAVTKSVGNYYEQDQITKAAIKVLTELEVLTDCDLTVAAGDTNVHIDGVYTTDIVKLRELPKEKFIELRDKDLLPLLYAQIFSINQFHRLSRYAAADK